MRNALEQHIIHGKHICQYQQLLGNMHKELVESCIWIHTGRFQRVAVVFVHNSLQAHFNNSLPWLLILDSLLLLASKETLKRASSE